MEWVDYIFDFPDGYGRYGRHFKWLECEESQVPRAKAEVKEMGLMSAVVRGDNGLFGVYAVRYTGMLNFED
jgi:hypothetical protein